MNFENLNKRFEDKFTISKKLLREEASLKSKKEKSKKRLAESIDRNLSERDWKLTIPGSFRDDMLNAGEEEDFDKVKNILIDICNYVLEHIDEADFDLDDQEYVTEEFEDFIEELEYIDFEDEDEANYYLNELYDLLDNTDIFLGLRESLLNERLVDGEYVPDNSVVVDLDGTSYILIQNTDGDNLYHFKELGCDDYNILKLSKKEVKDKLLKNGYSNDFIRAEILREAITEDVEEEEDLAETYRLAIIDWLYDHDQARKDIEAHMGVGIEHLSLKGLKAIISDYEQLARDFEAYFNDSLDESLNENKSGGQIDSAIKEKVIKKFNQEIDKSDIDHSIDEDGYGFHITRKDGSKLAYDASTGKFEFIPVKKFGENLKEEKITGGSMPQEDINIIQPLIDDFDSLEDANKDVLSITWNFGRRNSDNKMTAGVDIYFLAKGNEDNLQPYIKQVEDIILSDGYKFDDSLGYDEDHWKEHMFGDGYHTQIIEDVIEESLNEEYEEVDLSDYVYVGNVDGFSTYRKIITDENGDTRGVWAAQDQNEKEPPFKITYDQALGHEPIKDTHGIKKLSRDLGHMLLPHDESLNESEQNLESGYYPDKWDTDFEDELENLGIEPQRGVYIGYQYRVPNKRFASKMVRLAKEFGYDDSWVEGNILYLKWSRPEREYHKTPYDESLNESWVLFFDEDGINHAGSDGAHNFNLSPKSIERKIKSSDYHLPNWAKSYIILSDSEFDKMNYDEIEKYHKRYGKTLNEDTVKQNGKWVNKGKEGTHGKFKTKKEADAQRRAMFASGYKEGLEEDKKFGDKSIKAQLALPENQEKLNSFLQPGINWREGKQKFIDLIKSLDCTDANKKQAIVKIGRVNNEGAFYSTVGTYLTGDKTL